MSRTIRVIIITFVAMIVFIAASHLFRFVLIYPLTLLFPESTPLSPVMVVASLVNIVGVVGATWWVSRTVWRGMKKVFDEEEPFPKDGADPPQ